MQNYFEVKVKCEKTGEYGLPKKVNESYLVDALSFTEAEARIIEEIKPFVSGEFAVNNIKRSRIAELFDNSSGDKWYLAKVNFVTLDEEKAVEKKAAATMMVQAADIESARAYLAEKLKSPLSNWEISAVQETKIMDVFTYRAAVDVATADNDFPVGVRTEVKDGELTITSADLTSKE